MRTRVWLVVAAAIAVASVSSLAWACVPASWWVRVSPSSGTAGSSVTITGDGFAADESVSVYWGSTATKLAEVPGPKFSVTVTVPANAAAGVHYIQATGSSGRGGATDAFTVVPATRQPTGPPGTRNQAPSPSPGSAPVAPRAGQTPEPLVVRAPRESSAPRRNPIEREAVRSPVVQAAGAPVFADSVGPAQRTVVGAPAAASRGRAQPARTGTAARPPTRATALDDLWSGFASSAAPSLGSAASGAEERTRSGLGLSVALLATGLLALLSGLMLAARRRRARAADRG